MEFLIKGLLVGISATIFMDLVAWIQTRIFNIASLDYALVGRWIGHFPKGVFTHKLIVKSPPIQGERIIGWIAHYIIGITFAFVMLFSGFNGILIGLITVLAPFCLMQPGFGFGYFANKAPSPNLFRLKSLWAHFVYGVGLYLFGLILI